MPATLIVIDMQVSFPAACEPNVVIAVTREIMEAKQRGEPIILVEYKGCGPSHSEFYNILKGYPYKSHICKSDDDGSREILRAIRRRKFDHSELRICGVNFDCCVKHTVEGLLHQSPHSRITVVKSACGSEWDVDVNEYEKHPNLNMVKS